MSYENSDGGGGGVMMGDVGEEEEVKVAPAAIVFTCLSRDNLPPRVQ